MNTMHPSEDNLYQVLMDSEHPDRENVRHRVRSNANIHLTVQRKGDIWRIRGYQPNPRRNSGIFWEERIVGGNVIAPKELYLEMNFSELVRYFDRWLQFIASM